MKKLILSASFAFALLTTTNTFAQQGFGTNQPDKSAAVDIVSSKRGLLIPRINITNLNNAAPVSNPATSLFVYNTNTTSGEGFYYWDGSKWVRFTSTNNERDVIVQAAPNGNIDIPAATYDTNGIKTYNVSVQGGTENGQVLVTKVDGATTTTEWVNPADFIQGINGITVEQVTDSTTGIVENVVKLGGTLTEDTTIITDGNKVMIQGLSQVTDMTDQVVAVGHYQTGEVKVATPGQIVSNTLTDGSGTTAVYDATTGKNQVDLGGKLTKPAVIETEGANTIAITGLNEVVTADLTANDKIVIMGNDGVLKITSRTSLFDAKDLTLGDGLTFEAGIDDNDGVGAVLKATKIEIEDNSVTALKLDAKGETEGHVATVNNDGTVTYQAITPASLTDKKTLTTDGVIVIGEDSDATATTAAESVLADVKLNIGKDKITADHIATGAVTSDEILDGTIQVADIKAPGTTTDSSTGGTANQVMVTDQNGSVTWVNQSDLGNKDSYTGIGAIDITANGTSTNGINYDVSVSTATGTNLGVVKEAVTPTVNINATGELAVNLTNTVLAGDVTGPLNATKVEAIQGTAVSATPPTATNNVLKYDGTAWTPAQLQGTDVAGKAITSTSLTVSADGATAALKDVTIDITPGTAEGQILTTTNTGTITDPVLSTNWATPNSLVAVDNGLKKVADDVIHLGGTLKEVTEIKTSSTNTLAISGLEVPESAETNKIMIVEDGGVLRSVTRSLSDNITTSYTVSDIAGYNTNVQEINLRATIGSSDIDITLPAATLANKGQVVNIGIANETEPSFYVNIIANGNTLTYGSMPYQGWIIKSNGSDWVIVGRN